MSIGILVPPTSSVADSGAQFLISILPVPSIFKTRYGFSTVSEEGNTLGVVGASDADFWTGLAAG
jgi:hypothetical protein